MTTAKPRPPRRPGYRAPLSFLDQQYLLRQLAPAYDEAQVRHGVQWRPSLGGAGAPAFEAATRRSLAFLTAWGLQQRVVDQLEGDLAEQRVRGDIGEELARHWREAEHATHQLLGRPPIGDTPTVQLRIAKDQ